MMIYRFFVFIYLLMTASAICRRRPVRQIIQRHNCLPKQILNIVCEGSCNSNNRTDESASLSEQRQSCHVIRSRERVVRLQCFNSQSNSFRSHHISIVVPMFCACGLSQVNNNVDQSNTTLITETRVNQSSLLNILRNTQRNIGLHG